MKPGELELELEQLSLTQLTKMWRKLIKIYCLSNKITEEQISGRTEMFYSCMTGDNNFQCNLRTGTFCGQVLTINCRKVGTLLLLHKCLAGQTRLHEFLVFREFQHNNHSLSHPKLRLIFRTSHLFINFASTLSNWSDKCKVGECLVWLFGLWKYLNYILMFQWNCPFELFTFGCRKEILWFASDNSQK